MTTASSESDAMARGKGTVKYPVSMGTPKDANTPTAARESTLGSLLCSSAMDDAQLLRYSRHILLSELGVDAQLRFAAAHALIIGAGGLGAPVAQFLAAAGVGLTI